jgi:putative serine protease PepD
MTGIDDSRRLVMHITMGRLALGAVVLALLAGIVGGILGALIRSDRGASGSAGSPAAADSAMCDVTDVAARVFPSLVTINVRRGSVAGSGSGSVLDREGDILTNDHVIAPAIGGTITVDFARGQVSVPATVVGRDPATDLAVIRVQPGAAPLTTIAIGDSAALVVGQPVVAAGSPLGLNGTITAGVVSALSRYVNVGQGDEAATLVNAVQTDAAVNPGNSGGPLTDCSGRQVAVNSAGAQTPGGAGGSIGLNFAIPIDFALSVAQQLIQTGRATHPVIGVLTATVTDEMAQATGLPRGAVAEEVLPGLGAARAGLRKGDVITKVGDTGVNSTDQMLLAIRTHKAGDTIQLGYSRSGAARSAAVTVTES